MDRIFSYPGHVSNTKTGRKSLALVEGMLKEKK